MKAKPLVTVLMSVYNGEKYLSEAIESILNQTFKDFEFIIINDGSTDCTREIILSYDDPRINLMENHKNIGLTRSLNKGIVKAKGKYIARMDADDICLSERLEKQLAFMEANDEVAVCGAKGLLIDSKGSNIGYIEPIAYLHDDIKIKMMIMNQFIHSVAFIRKTALLEVGCYDEKIKYAQDYKLWMDILASGYLMFNLDAELIKHRLHDDKVSLNNIKKQEDYACRIIKYGFKRIYNTHFSVKDITMMRRIYYYKDSSINPIIVNRVKKKFSDYL